MVYLSSHRVAALPGLVLCAALGAIAPSVIAMESGIAQSVQSDADLSQGTDENEAKKAEADRLFNESFEFWRVGQWQESLELLEQALVLYRAVGDRQGEGRTLTGLGAIADNFGDYPQALDYYQQALSINREIGDRAGEGSTLNNIGWALFQTGKFPDAEYQLSEAINILDELRNTALPPEDRISLFETQQGTYQKLQETLVAQNKIGRALNVSEQGRARVLAEQIVSSNLNSTLTTIPNLDQIRHIAQQQNATLISYSIIPDKDSSLYIWVVSPNGMIAFKQVPLFTTDDITPNTIASLIQPDSPFYRGTPTTSADTLIADTRSTLGIGRGIGIELIDDAETSDRLHQLHQLLIDPIQDYLPTDPNEKVIFIGLFMVPFPALQDENGTYLIEKHTILTAPSIQVLGLTPQLKNGTSNDFSSSLVVGNPTMPSVWNPDTGNEEQLSTLKGAEQEAIDIANLFNTQALTGRQATEATVKQQMAQAELIHFATHGLLEYGNPQDSGVLDVPGAIALAPSPGRLALTPGNGEDGLLTSAEILGMELNADLVVLSACDTGRGRITGDGVIGLSRSLITAGVPSIMVSLWSVPDAPTATLMTEFYGNMRQGMDKAQALREAMLMMVEEERHPRDWAAFTLIGESD